MYGGGSWLSVDPSWTAPQFNLSLYVSFFIFLLRTPILFVGVCAQTTSPPSNELRQVTNYAIRTAKHSEGSYSYLVVNVKYVSGEVDFATVAREKRHGEACLSLSLFHFCGLASVDHVAVATTTAWAEWPHCYQHVSVCAPRWNSPTTDAAKEMRHHKLCGI